MRSKGFLIPLYIWLFFFVLFPFALVVYYGVTIKADDGSIVFSLANFARFTEGAYVRVFIRSLKVAAIATSICLVAGYPAAYILARGRMKRKSILLLLIMLPMWMNFLLRTYSWLSLLENSGLINSILGRFGVERIQFLYNENAVVFGTVYNFLPFMIMPINVVLLKLDDSLLEAAYDLGASPVKRFLRITLPFSVPGILSGIAMVFVPSVTTFVISQLMGGGKVPLVGDIIERQFRVVNDWNFGATVSLLVMFVVLAFMFAINRDGAASEGERSVIP